MLNIPQYHLNLLMHLSTIAIGILTKFNHLILDILIINRLLLRLQLLLIAITLRNPFL